MRTRPVSRVREMRGAESLTRDEEAIMAGVRAIGRVFKGQRVLAAATAMYVAAGLSVGATAEERDADSVHCDSVSTDLRIDGCTALILTRHDTGELVWAFNNRGAAYERKGQYDRAIQDFNEALKLEQDFAEVFYNRGVAYADEGELDHAIEDYGRAIRLKGDYAAAYNNRGNAYKQKVEYDRAIVDYDHAIKIKPDYAAAFNNRGNTYKEKGEYERAIVDFDEAIRLKPDYAAAYNNRGVVFDARRGV